MSAHDEPTRSMPKHLSNREYLTQYLRESVESGDQFFKAKKIAMDIQLSPKQIGQLLAKLSEEETDLVIEKWNTRSPVTWRIERR